MTVSRYALVNATNMVVNVVMWDGNVETWQPEEGLIAHILADGQPGGPGDLWDSDTQQVVRPSDG